MAKRQRNKPKIGPMMRTQSPSDNRKRKLMAETEKAQPRFLRTSVSSAASKPQMDRKTARHRTARSSPQSTSSKPVMDRKAALPRITRSSPHSTSSKPVVNRDSETARSRITMSSTLSTSSKPVVNRDSETARPRITGSSTLNTSSKPVLNRDSETARPQIVRTSTRSTPSIKPVIYRDSETARPQITGSSTLNTSSKAVVNRDSETARPQIARTSTRSTPSIKPVIYRDSETKRPQIKRPTPLSTSTKPVVDRDSETALPRIKRSSPRSSSSTPSSLYDFMGESPVMDSEKNTGKKVIQVKKVATTTKKQSKLVTKNIIGKSTVSIKITTKVAATPPGVASKAVVALETVNYRKECKEGGKRYRALRPIPPPNLDDISPIPRDCKSTTLSIKRKAASKQKTNDKCVKKVRLRSSKEKENLIQVTPNVSFTDNTADTEANESPIFVSPRQTLLRFSTGKTSTPADIPPKGKKIPVKKNVRKTVTDTSTPIESQPKRGFTRVKQHISKLSPVNCLGTPTSDYGSMESFSTPSPTSATKTNRAKRGNSPAFTLDDGSGEALNLNKSVEKSYKRSRNKYDSARFSTSKLEEWADKVNSELEDIENFELSVEG